jgi:hypothetical protein
MGGCFAQTVKITNSFSNALAHMVQHLKKPSWGLRAN